MLSVIDMDSCNIAEVQKKVSDLQSRLARQKAGKTKRGLVLPARPMRPRSSARRAAKRPPLPSSSSRKPPRMQQYASADIAFQTARRRAPTRGRSSYMSWMVSRNSNIQNLIASAKDSAGGEPRKKA